MSDEVPTEHPRAVSLRLRERLVAGIDAGLTSQHGLIAHGRGEAIDYLLGEQTIESAATAAKTGVAAMLLADNPVISVNGNVAALAPEATVELANALDAPLEVNLFHRSDERVDAIAQHLRDHGASTVFGLGADATIPGLSHDRGQVHEEGIFSADVVLVPLEDGDRAEALGAMDKTEIVIDLNPLSRSTQTASIPICDNLVRALPLMTEAVTELETASEDDLRAMVDVFDADATLADALEAIRSGDFAGLSTDLERM